MSEPMSHELLAHHVLDAAREAKHVGKGALIGSTWKQAQKIHEFSHFDRGDFNAALDALHFEGLIRLDRASPKARIDPKELRESELRLGPAIFQLIFPPGDTPMHRTRRKPRKGLMARAMRHPDVPGAGAAKRKKLDLTGREKAATVMKEFYHGKLRRKCGELVSDPQVAKAIAMSEGRKAEHDPLGLRVLKARKPRRRRTTLTAGHHSPFAVVYGQFVGQKHFSVHAFQDEKTLNRELQHHSAKLWDTGIGELTEAMSEAVRAARKHKVPAVVYDQSSGEALHIEHPKASAHHSNPGTRTMRRTQPVDETAVHELRLFAENTGELYPQHQAIVESLKKKMAAGKYDPAKAVKAWTHWFDRAAVMYQKEIGAGDLNLSFPPAVRRAAAAEFERDQQARLRAGEFGPVVARKGRKTAMRRAASPHASPKRRSTKHPHSPHHSAGNPGHATHEEPVHRRRKKPTHAAEFQHKVEAWERKWHKWIEANKSAHLPTIVRAGRALLKFDQQHHLPSLPHLRKAIADARKMLRDQHAAMNEAKQLEHELEQAERIHHDGIRQRRAKVTKTRAKRLRMREERRRSRRRAI